MVYKNGGGGLVCEAMDVKNMKDSSLYIKYIKSY